MQSPVISPGKTGGVKKAPPVKRSKLSASACVQVPMGLPVKTAEEPGRNGNQRVQSGESQMKNPDADMNRVINSNRSRNLKQLRNALARRKLQELHDEKVLRSWLAEVWDQSTWSDQFEAGRRFH
jgi:hypothetical protein